MLGLKNCNENISVLTNFTIVDINNTSNQYLKIVSLKNQSLFDNNTVELLGTDIIISDIVIKKSSDITYQYYMYQTIFPEPIGTTLKLFFYDPNFIRIINIPYIETNKYIVDSITVLIELLASDNSIVYSYLINLNFDYVDTYKVTEYVLFFKNYVNTISYSGINIRVFDIDYSIYFINLGPGDYILCNQITLSDSNLYDILIGTNSNIPAPTIPDLEPSEFNKEINFQKLSTMINFENTSGDLVAKFLSAEEEQFDILVNYLNNYKIKSYNFYNINYSYFYETKPPIAYTEVQNKNRRDIIFPQNVMLNGILVNIEILYTNSKNEPQSYNIYGMIMNNNNTWDIYTKKYSLDPVNKYNLLKDITLIGINYTQINVYLYNDITDLNSNIKIPIISSSNSTIPNIYYRYNKFILNKENSSVGYSLDDNYYLKFYVNIKAQYKMLIFYSQTLVSSDYDIINMKLDNISNQFCKILKIKNYTGSVLPNFTAFSMMFQTTKEINDFINYLETGIYNPNNSTVKSYFNIPKTINFIKQPDGYYVPTNLITGVINFSIINLDLIVGNVFTNNSISYQ